MKTKRVRNNSLSKTPLPVILQTIEQYYEELRQDPVMALSATYLWHAAEDIRIMRALAHKVMMEKKAGKNSDDTDQSEDGDSDGVWAPLSCTGNYGTLKQ